MVDAQWYFLIHAMNDAEMYAFMWIDILHWVVTAYRTSGKKVTEKMMDSAARKDHRSVK